MRWPYPNIGVLTTRAFRNLLNKIFGDIGADMQEQKSRVDNLITSNPQPSEIQDMRTGRDGQTYPVARDMVLGEIAKTEAAQAEINQDTAAQLAEKAEQIYVDQVLSIVTSGGPDEIFYSIDALNIAYPSGANRTKLVFDSSFPDGAHSFLWNGTIWDETGLYQANGLGDRTVTRPKIALDAVSSAELAPGAVTTPKVANDAITSFKRTKLGNYAYINSQYPLNHNTTTQKLEFGSGFNNVACGDQHIPIDETQVANGVNISTTPNMMKFNLITRLISEGRPTLQEEVSLGSIGGFFNAKYTIDGHDSTNPDNEYEDYQPGLIYFTVPVNQVFDDNEQTTDNLQDSETIENIHCVLILPTTYTPNGQKTKLMLSAHGAGRHVGDGETNALAYANQYTNKGYALFDVNGGTNENFQGMGAPRAIEAYWKAYQYIVQHYNVEDKIYLHGQSMGGLTALNFALAHPNIIKAAGIWYPCTDLYNQAWLNPWNTTSPIDGSDGTYPTKICIAKEYNFNDQTGATWEPDKVVGYNPIANDSVLVGDDRYNHFPVPLKIWHGKLDDTIDYNGSITYVSALKRAGIKAYLRLLDNGIHAENQVLYDELVYWFGRF